ncbi:hypothetical protein SAMN04489761_3491 [Tenacibaculum sp. MAR_2009_124]|nr:hypothetical protein [Tenacibaculum sp. MAR_2009_124]SEC68256.1 hypothetical protein SAMN04489761_3491 [Tenacibaculum sp. MAR_2009_124]
MLNYWSDHNQRVYLPTLFDYLNYKLLATDKKYVVYGKSGFYYVVIKTDKGFLYYNTQQPELKLQASDLVEEYVAKIEGREVKGLWGKLHNKFNEYLDKECDLLLNTEEIALEIVDTNFNHFLLLNIPFSSQANANNSKEVDKLYKG